MFLNKKRQSGCYCKVYKKEKDFAVKFYRDGYTDITGAFKYAMDDLDGITDFAILVVTDQGGVITKVKPPSKQNFIAQ